MKAISRVDKSVFCLVARVTFRATGLLSIETKITQLLVAQCEKMIALGVQACIWRVLWISIRYIMIFSLKAVFFLLYNFFGVS